MRDKKTPGNWLKAAIAPNKDFIEETKKFDKWDMQLSLVVFILAFLLLYVAAHFAGVLTYADMEEGFIRYFAATAIAAAPSLIVIGLVFLACKIRKQKIMKPSFNKSNTVKSLIVGFIVGTIHISLLLLVIWRDQFTGIREDLDLVFFITSLIAQIVFIVFMEELLVRAYMGPRFYGVFENKIFSIIVVGAMFSFLHVPARMFQNDATFWQTFLDPLITDTLIHSLLFWIYAKYNNIFGPMLYHLIINFVWWMVA